MTTRYTAPFGPDERINPDGVYKELVLEVDERRARVYLSPGDPGVMLPKLDLPIGDDAAAAFLTFFIQNSTKKELP